MGNFHSSYNRLPIFSIVLLKKIEQNAYCPVAINIKIFDSIPFHKAVFAVEPMHKDQYWWILNELFFTGRSRCQRW